MPIADYLHPSGRKVKAGESGRVYSNVGIIYFDRAPKAGIDQNLFAVLKISADALRLILHVSSIDTGKHSTGSRHYAGLAADVWRVGPITKRPAPEVKAEDPLCEQWAEWLGEQGFRHYENGPWACVLYGGPRSEYNKTSSDHSDHLHLSLPRR